jgi:AraC family transcriptional activator of pobA
MLTSPPYRIRTISAYHQFRRLPPPEHPLFSIIDLRHITHLQPQEPLSLVLDFYAIGFKRDFNAKVRYGQQPFDFDEGVLGFTSPGQVFSLALNDGEELTQVGRLLLIHPDFLWNTPLARKMKQYDFFGYAVNEALFLSAKEEALIRGIVHTMEHEYRARLDAHSADIIIAQLETLLAYSQRFYQRQFITRKKVHHGLLAKVEDVLQAYFNGEAIQESGLPTVAYLAEQVHISPNYLGGLLRSLTGMSTQQHIQAALLAKAKELLSTTDLSIGEVAFRVGFEHLPSFSKLFKTKTHLSPAAFRKSFR